MERVNLISLPLPTHTGCLNSNLVTVLDTGDGLKVSHFSSGTVRQYNFSEDLPSVCHGGCGFSRCNIINITGPMEHSTPRSTMAIPVVRGVLLIVFEMINGTRELSANHTLELPHEMSGLCQVAYLMDLTGVSQDRSHFTTPPQVTGLCLNESRTDSIHRVSIMIDFNNISKSSLSQDVNDNPVDLDYLETVSNFVFSKGVNIPQCWSTFMNSQTFFYHKSSVGLFDVTSEENSVQMYWLYRGDELFVCNSPLQLVHIPRDVLVLHCRNVSVQIDICKLSSVSVTDLIYHDSTDGIPYYCSSDMNTFVSVRGETVIFNSTLNGSVTNITINETVYFGECIKQGNSTIFVYASPTGSIYIVDPQWENPLILLTRSHSQFVKHQVYEDLILYNNGTSSVLYNTSCKDDPVVVTISHPYHLSLHTFDRGLRSCSCSSPDNADSTTTQSMNNTQSVYTSTYPQPFNPANNNRQKHVIGAVVGVILCGAVIVSFVIAVILIYKMR